MPVIDKVVIVTRPSQLDELVQRFNTREQARFYIEHMGGSFAEYEAAHAVYQQARTDLRNALPTTARVQWLDRSFLPNYTFGPNDLIVVLGQDGLVVNAAKYLSGQLVLAVNPDPTRIDGLLLPFALPTLPRTFRFWREGRLGVRRVTMAKAELNDGQTLHAVNDLFIGPKTHASARYRLRIGDREEEQSSSGIIVSTGAGSTGWLRSILTGAAGIVHDHVPSPTVAAVKDSYSFNWESQHLIFHVREPFISRTSSADIVSGRIALYAPLVIESLMPQNGVIFSDGIESDFLAFNSGAIATIGLSEKTLNLIVPAKVHTR